MTIDLTGWTKAQRAARRKWYADRAVAQARAFERSIKCANYERHAGDPDGCRNDGSRCLCECHDPAEGGTEHG